MIRNKKEQQTLIVCNDFLSSISLKLKISAKALTIHKLYFVTSCFTVSIRVIDGKNNNHIHTLEKEMKPIIYLYCIEYRQRREMTSDETRYQTFQTSHTYDVDHESSMMILCRYSFRNVFIIVNFQLRK